MAFNPKLRVFSVGHRVPFRAAKSVLFGTSMSEMVSDGPGDRPETLLGACWAVWEALEGGLRCPNRRSPLMFAWSPHSRLF
eukprot:5623383-Pyramimonas_sp.AAC.1